VKRALILSLACILLASVPASSQTRRRSPSRRSARALAASAQQKQQQQQQQQTEVRAGRERIATQIKALSQFLYLLGGISKGIETAEQANRNHEESSVALPVGQIERNKIRVKDSIKTVRAGLDQLEASFRSNAALQGYYPNLAGVARIGQMAESQAASNNFDQAGRSLITAVNKLTDALAALR
jgi:hypothetical protein